MTREDLRKIAMCYAHDELKDNHGDVEDIVASAFIDGANYADAHPNWISVDDELPNFFDIVLYCDEDGNYYTETDNIGEDVKITHWMHIPNCPPLQDFNNKLRAVLDGENKEGGEEMERLTVEWQDPCNNHREKIRVLLYEKGMTSKEIVERLCDVYKNEHVDLETLLYWAIQTGYNKCDCNPKKGGEE